MYVVNVCCQCYCNCHQNDPRAPALNSPEPRILLWRCNGDCDGDCMGTTLLQHHHEMVTEVYNESIRVRVARDLKLDMSTKLADCSGKSFMS